MEAKIWKALMIACAVLATTLTACVTAPTPAFVAVTPVAQAALEREIYVWQSGDEADVSVQLGTLKQAYQDSVAYENLLAVTNDLLSFNTTLSFEHNRAVDWISDVPIKAALQTAAGISAGVGLGILVDLLVRR